MTAYLSALLQDPEDARDYIFEPEDVILPDAVDLREFTGLIEDQSNLNSCTGNTAASGGEAYLIAGGVLADTVATDEMDLSRLFNYSTSRKAIGLLNQDIGSSMREALRSMRNLGICRESVWPYDMKKVNADPSPEAYADAANHKLHAYYRIPLDNTERALYAVKYALAKGWPVAVSMQVGQKLFSLKPTDSYWFVNPTLNPYAGNHAMLIVGYFHKNGIPYFIFEGSYGPNWCDRGYMTCVATVPIIDGLDLWVLQGFAGIERVGVDRTQPKPVPVVVEPELPPVVPVPEPVPDPIPEPIPPTPEPDPLPVPVPPEPIPEPPAPTTEPVIQPEPDQEPAPVAKSGSDSLPLILAALVIIAFIIYRFGGIQP